jgi:putative addiction module killer protein
VETKPKTVEHYVDGDNRDTFGEWMESLRDFKAFAKINIRIKRVEQGNFGDHGPVGEGVSELREHDGKGHRVYYGIDGDTVILLTGGIKDTQVKDIARAKVLWKDYNHA